MSPVHRFFWLLGNAAEASDAVDDHDGVDPLLVSRQAEAARELILFCRSAEALSVLEELLKQAQGAARGVGA